MPRQPLQLKSAPAVAHLRALGFDVTPAPPSHGHPRWMAPAAALAAYTTYRRLLNTAYEEADAVRAHGASQ